MERSMGAAIAKSMQPPADGFGSDRPPGERQGREAVHTLGDQRRHQPAGSPRPAVRQIALDVRRDAAVVPDLDAGVDARAGRRLRAAST